MVPAGSSQFYLLLTARDDQMTGKLYGPGAKTGLPFTSLSRMVLQLEELMDTRGDAWEPWAPPEGFPKEALELEILFRQNYSWQAPAAEDRQGSGVPQCAGTAAHHRNIF